MFLNRVFQHKETGEQLRVVYEAIEAVWVIDINSKYAWPSMLEQDEFEEVIGTGLYIEIEEPFAVHVATPESIQEKKRDEAYSTLKPLLSRGIQLISKKDRNELIASVVKESGKPRLYVVRQLRRYWQRGMSPNALIPDYHRSGVKGKTRRDHGNKTGAKRTISSGKGIIVTDEVAEIFDLAISGFFIQNHALSLEAAKVKAVGLYRSRYPHADKKAYQQCGSLDISTIRTIASMK